MLIRQLATLGGLLFLNFTVLSAQVASIAAMDVSGDNISKAVNANASSCTFAAQEWFNWATSDTHGTEFCSAGAEGVYSQKERIECASRANIAAPSPNHAASGAQMLKDFVNQANAIKSWLLSQPAPRFTAVFMGHNDLCGGKLDKVNTACDAGLDQDPNNYCRTTPAAFERELRKGLDILITVPDARIGVAAPLRISQACNIAEQQACSWRGTCQAGWSAVSYLGWIFGPNNGICGSLTTNCSDDRVSDAYLTAKSYRDILQRVTAEYERIPPGGTSPVVTVGGQFVGGAVKATGVSMAFSDAPWKYKFSSSQLSCCDCFHPSRAGQNNLSRILMRGLTCGGRDACCNDTGDPVADGRCASVLTDGTYIPGLFN